MASPTGEPDTTSTDAPVTTVTEAPASETTVDEAVTEETAPEEAVNDGAEVSEEAGTLPPGLAEALLRDLGMTVEEFEAAGELGQKAADALPELQAAEGFVSVAIEDNKIVITGSGEALEALALELDATLVAPAGEVTDEAEATEAPAEETAEAPAAEATEAAEEPAAEATEAAEEPAAKISLSGDYRAEISKIRSDYISSVGVQGLQSILLTADGYVISVDKSAIVDDSVLARSMAEVAGTPADAFAERYSNVTISDSSGPATPLEEVVNGQGYAIDGAFLCSVGFNGFDPTGKPAVITAGHCNDDGNLKEADLTDPVNDEANGGTQPSLGSHLGTFGFSQFGGKGNSPIADPVTGGNIGTDIAAIDDINGELDLLPETTQWKNASDLTADTVTITGTVEAVNGAPVCKSGRTTGWSCGEVTGLGEFYVVGHNGADDIRGVLGFESTLEVNAAPGDSGGSVISGSNAMGITSAGVVREGVERLSSTSLVDGLNNYLGGYSVAVFVDAPNLTSHENKGTVLTEETISGTTTGTSVKLTRDGATVDLPVAEGKWSFPAPSTVPEGGTLEFKVQAINGFNKSKAVSYELTVEEAPLAAPAITNPANGTAIVDSVDTISGTGTEGAEVTVKLTGTDVRDDEETANSFAAVEATVTVGAKGKWEWKLNEALTYGEYSVTATQDGVANKAKSPETTSKFSVILEKAAITSITEGQDFAEGENPADISGTGTAGAKVDVTIGENTLSATVGDNGDWKVTGFPVLVPGSYTVSAVQTLEGATSAPAEVTFTVTEVVVEEAAPPVVPPAPAPDNNGDGLPDTGAAGMGLFAGAGLLLTAGGISALLINRRRQLQDA
ncbi:S1 family peptidase [Arthrobacter sp. zg-Y1219]|uniref:S1 family peptidase n=1 Tax=Arthrobacter sp. zg-Y1219 TaxID=3049067 RepID=UPI0024C42A03|nr:S1 family peptidase [Arthrobacter sp. zg-Y1219]MDK1360698.1 S1 family peptidase [Arthrobacter sp. zg-Y1219]